MANKTTMLCFIVCNRWGSRGRNDFSRLVTAFWNEVGRKGDDLWKR